MDVIDLTRELVSIESTSAREGQVAAFVADRFEAGGWHVVRQPIEEGEPNYRWPRMNVLATASPLPPEVILTTHLDTVPPYIPLSEDSEYLYGRGTCDAKGIFAAMWVAAERLRQEGVERIGLLGVVAEETNSLGAKNVSAILPSTKWIVDGEPTDNLMTSAAKGVLALKLKTKGIAGHSAYPDRGRSAVHDLVNAVNRLISAELPWRETFGKTTVNIGRIDGGVAGNVLAQAAEALVVVRAGDELSKIRSVIDNALGDEVEQTVLTASDPLEIHVPEGWSSAPVSFGSDVPHLRSIGTPLLVGPGSIHDAHTKGEKIGKADLKNAVDLYENLVRTLLRT